MHSLFLQFLQRLFSNIDNNYSIFFLCFTSNKNFFYLSFALLFKPFIKNVPLCCNVALSFDKWRVPPRRLFSRPHGMVRTPHSLPGPPSTYRPGRRIDWLIDWSVLMFKTYRKSLSQLSYKRLTLEIKWVLKSDITTSVTYKMWNSSLYECKIPVWDDKPQTTKQIVK